MSFKRLVVAVVGRQSAKHRGAKKKDVTKKTGRETLYSD